jgi:hypothetical protein
MFSFSDCIAWQGDCLDLLPRIPTGSVDMILCDLPYGTTSHEWDKRINLVALWAEYNRVLKVNGACLLFSQCPFDKILGASNLKALRYEYRERPGLLRDSSTETQRGSGGARREERRMREIKVLKDGLLIGGHRYNAGDVVLPEHRTHDVVQAADGRGGQLAGWVLRDKLPAPAAEPAPESGDGEVEASAEPA